MTIYVLRHGETDENKEGIMQGNMETLLNENGRKQAMSVREKVKEAGIRKTALVTVGRFLGDTFELSKLYDAHFTTEFRKGV